MAAKSALSSPARLVPTLRKRAARSDLRDDPPPYTPVATDMPLIMSPCVFDIHTWSHPAASSQGPSEVDAVLVEEDPASITAARPRAPPGPIHPSEIQHVMEATTTNPSSTLEMSITTNPSDVRHFQIEHWTPRSLEIFPHLPIVQNALSVLQSIALATVATLFCSLTGLFLAHQRVRTIHPFSTLRFSTVIPLTVLGSLILSTACIYPLIHYEAHKARSCRPHSTAGIWLVRAIYIMALSILPFAVGVALLPGAIPAEVTKAHAVQLCVWGFVRLVLVVLNVSAVFVCGWMCGVRFPVNVKA